MVKTTLFENAFIYYKGSQKWFRVQIYMWLKKISVIYFHSFIYTNNSSTLSKASSEPCTYLVLHIIIWVASYSKL